jgi:xanthine/CO dehydrogenase XdhC/CoxF family maturation factor
MKELADIIALARTRRMEHAALATVVRTEGSSYRRPGASLLIGSDGLRLGSVSGGCLERDVEKHAKEVLASGEPRVVIYDTREDVDMVFGTALGCGGLVEVFIERLPLQSDLGPVARWAAAADRRETLVELMIVTAPAPAPMAVGERAWVDVTARNESATTRPDTDTDADVGIGMVEDGGDPAAASLVSALMREGQPLIDARQSGLVTHATPAGDVRAFVRVIEPPVRLVICGAGDDAQPLARMAQTLGWRVWVLDHRAGFATKERFPDAERVQETIAGTLPSDITLDPRTVAVIMNHHYPSDGAWLSALAPLPITYLGLLGARHRTARLLRDAELPSPGPGGLPHLFAPAGLDIGAEGPEGIALAMLAEMQSVIAGRRGGRLRESPSPIQQTPLEAAASPVPSGP